MRPGWVHAGNLSNQRGPVAHLRGRLSSFKVPKAIRFVDELPRNASGKILKWELR